MIDEGLRASNASGIDMKCTYLLFIPKQKVGECNDLFSSRQEYFSRFFPLIVDSNFDKREKVEDEERDCM